MVMAGHLLESKFQCLEQVANLQAVFHRKLAASLLTRCWLVVVHCRRRPMMAVWWLRSHFAV
jgi:hypothetical protein